MNSQRTCTISACFVLLACGSTLTTAADHYSIQDLGTLGDATVASGLNDQGVAVGYAVDILYRYHGFTAENGVFTPITTMGPTSQGQAVGINSINQTIVASYMLGEFDTTALMYDNGMLTSLGQFMPTAINDSTQIVGSKFVTASGGYEFEQAVRWDAGVLTSLGQLNGGNSSLALGINESGWAVGSAFATDALQPSATLWISTMPIDLGTLGGSWSQATGINDSNQVVGVSQNTSGVNHAFLFNIDKAGTVLNRIDLGELAGGYSTAKAINNAGVVVGTSDNRAFIWSNGMMQDLNTLIDPTSQWNLATATGINDSGQIVGFGAFGGDPFRAFLLTPDMPCPPDINGDGVLNFFDISAFLKAFSVQDTAADFNGDGMFNFFDISSFLVSYSAGCP